MNRGYPHTPVFWEMSVLRIEHKGRERRKERQESEWYLTLQF